MCSQETLLRTFAKELYRINAIKFGEFKTKIGIMTPVYCDLRVIVSYPKLLDNLANLLVEEYKTIRNFDIICGVPYTALPIATAVSMKTLIPMVMRRKEAKSYGTKKLIEGAFIEGNKCLIIEDVVTTGSSILETVADLKDAGLICSDAIVLLNREQGGHDILKSNNIQMHALYTFSQLMEYLRLEGCIDHNMVTKVKEYLSFNQIDSSIKAKLTEDRLKLSFQDRLKYAKNKAAMELMKIIVSKKTTLCVAVDLTESTEILNIAEQIGPHICALKTHIDIVHDFHPNLIKPLQGIAMRHNFLLFEDRKFCDIGKTVEFQFSEGLYKISSWANLITAHSLMGNGTLDAIKKSKGIEIRGVFLLAQASCSNNLANGDYVKDTLEMAKNYPELITGIVCQSPLFKDSPGMLQLTPGVQIASSTDGLGQRYNSPEDVVGKLGADVVVVGRGIIEAADPEAMAIKYKNILWDTYMKRVGL